MSLRRNYMSLLSYIIGGGGSGGVGGYDTAYSHMCDDISQYMALCQGGYFTLCIIKDILLVKTAVTDCMWW